MPRPKIKFTEVKAYVPVNLPLINEIINGTNLKADKIRALFHQFYMERLRGASHSKLKEKEYFKGGWINLRSTTLIRVVSHDYKKYITHLETLGIIEIFRGNDGRKKYSKNGYSQLYRIKSKYLKKEIGIRSFRKELITDHIILKSIHKIKSQNKIQNAELIALNPKIKILSEMLKEFYFDVKRVEEYLNKVAEDSESMSELDSVDPRNLSDLLLKVDAITNKELHWEKVDLFGERFHTPMTNILSELRKFIKVRGFESETLVSLDIANSQPYFSSISVHSNLIENVLPEFRICIPILNELTTKNDFRLYTDLCAKGTLYEYWKEIRGISKDEAKTELFYIMYKTTKSVRGKLSDKEKERKKAVKEFEKHFPNISLAFTRIKLLTEKELPFIENLYVDRYGFFNKKYYKNLSCMMQRMESRIVIGRICPALLEKGIKPFITIHDSFILPAKMAFEANKIILDEFSKLGVTPPIIKIQLLK